MNPDDVPMHMRLLAKHNRNPNEISINAQLKKDDDGQYVSLATDLFIYISSHTRARSSRVLSMALAS